VLRIVHVVTRSHRRGAEVAASELAEALDLRGHKDEVLAIALAPDGNSVEGLPPLVSSARLGLLTLIRGARRLRQLLAEDPADVVVAHGGSAAFVVALARGSATSPQLVWQRILGFPSERWGIARRRVWRSVARRFDGVIALTPDMADEMRTLGYEGPTWVLPNARDPERFASVDRAAASASLRADIGLDAEVPLLAFVGHLVDQKQPQIALDVVSCLRTLGRDAHLVVAGDGPLRRAMARRIRDLHLEAHVTMLGHRDDPEVVFGAADLALITSRAEGVPGVAIEAQMSGCPVVSFLVGAVEDVVEDGITGAIVPEGDVGAMAQAIGSLLDDWQRLEGMRVAAAERASMFTTAAAAWLYAARFAELVPAGATAER